jgi:hypothetical protein
MLSLGRGRWHGRLIRVVIDGSPLGWIEGWMWESGLGFVLGWVAEAFGKGETTQGLAVLWAKRGHG